jgi:hypothetical protein
MLSSAIGICILLYPRESPTRSSRQALLVFRTHRSRPSRVVLTTTRYLVYGRKPFEWESRPSKMPRHSNSKEGAGSDVKMEAQ